MMLGKLNKHIQKIKPDPYRMPLRNINSKCVKDLNIRPETTELLEENIGKKLLITCLGNDFIDMKQKAPKKVWGKSTGETTSNLKAIAQQKSQVNLQGKKLQTMCQIRGSCPKFIKNSYNLITKIQFFKWT